jgi:hypothetical protein
LDAYRHFHLSPTWAEAEAYGGIAHQQDVNHLKYRLPNRYEYGHCAIRFRQKGQKCGFQLVNGAPLRGQRGA